MSADRPVGSPRTIFEALDEARLSYAMRMTDAGDPYAGFQWQSARPAPSAFTAMEWRGASRLVLHGINGPADADQRLRLTSALRIGQLTAGDDLTDLVLAFPHGRWLRGARVLDLLHYAEAVAGWCATATGEPPDASTLDLLGLLLDPLASSSGPGDVLDPVTGWRFHLASDGSTARVTTSLGHLTRTGGQDPWALVDRIQGAAPCGRLIQLDDGALAIDLVAFLDGGHEQEGIDAAVAHAGWLAGLVNHHLGLGPP